MTEFVTATELNQRIESPGEGDVRWKVHASTSDKSSALTAEGSLILPDMCFNLTFKLDSADINASGSSEEKKKAKQEEAGQRKKDYHEALRAVLTAGGLLHPRPDARAWRGLRSDKPFVIVADTSAICNGYIHWLCNALWHQRFEVAALSVVERELTGWADQQDFWKKIKERTKYRVARAATETPPANLIPSRPALEEKSALMLSKVVRPGEKSSDADILLVELAREILLSESKQVQPLFVTGDRNASRSAMSAMGLDKTLFIEPAQFDLDKPLFACASYWRPGSGDGFLHLLPLSRVLEAFLMIFDQVSLESSESSYTISRATQGNGVPSDWAEPIYKLVSIRTGLSPVTIPVEINSTPLTNSKKVAEKPKEALSPSYPLGQANRLANGYFVEGLNHLLQGLNLPKYEPTPEVRAETFGCLVLLGAAMPNGEPNEKSPFLEAIRRNDWGAVGTQLIEIAGFKKAIERVANGEKHTSRDEGHLAIARRIGLLIQFDRRETAVIADFQASSTEVLKAVQEIVGDRDGAVSLKEVQNALASRYKISPLLFERLVINVGNSKDFPFVLETGGAASTKEKQIVYHFVADRVEEREIYADNSRFGGERTYRSIRRKSHAESI